MPQMKPMNWLYQFAMMSTMMLIMYSFLYFISKNMNMKKNKNNIWIIKKNNSNKNYLTLW